MITKDNINEYISQLTVDSLIDVRVMVMRADYGEGFATKVLKAVVEEILPHLVKTNRGYFRHNDVYFWNNGGYKNDR